MKKTHVPPGIYDSINILKELSRPSIPPYVYNKFCKKDLYQNVFFPLGEYWEDVATTFIPVSRARKIAVLNRPLYYYRQRPDAITKRAIADHSIYKWRFLQYRKRFEFLKKNYPMIADVAKKSVLKNGLFYYAWFHKLLEKTERRQLHQYLCSREFASEISGRKLSLYRFVFRFFPRQTSFMIRTAYKE